MTLCHGVTYSKVSNKEIKILFLLNKIRKTCTCSVTDPGGCRGGHAPSPSPVKISHKKMAAKGSHIDFMFLGPPYPAAGSDAAGINLFIYQSCFTVQLFQARLQSAYSLTVGCKKFGETFRQRRSCLNLI